MLTELTLTTPCMTHSFLASVSFHMLFLLTELFYPTPSNFYLSFQILPKYYLLQEAFLDELSHDPCVSWLLPVTLHCDHLFRYVSIIYKTSQNLVA